MMKIKLIEDYDDKQKIARLILEALPDWFGIDAVSYTHLDVYKRQVRRHERLPKTEGEPL